jgi:hypothetical protein
MTKETMPNVIIDKNSTYGKKPPVVITSQGTPEHNKPSHLTISAHDKAERFIEKMNVIRLEKIKQIKPQQQKSKISTFKKKERGVKK